MTTNSYLIRRPITLPLRTAAWRHLTPSSNEINQATGVNLKLDNKERNLYPDQLDKDAKKAFDKLSKELDKLLDSQVDCPGDGNLDGVVDQTDIDQFTYWRNLTGGYSSWYDFNLDGRTTHPDLRTIIDGKFPRKCPQ